MLLASLDLKVGGLLPGPPAPTPMGNELKRATHLSSCCVLKYVAHRIVN